MPDASPDLSRLLAKNVPALRAIVVASVPPVDVDDVLQDCLTAAWRSGSTIRCTESARSWLIGVTVRVVAKYHRARRVRTRWLVDSVEPDESPSSFSSPERVLAMARAEARLTQLPSELREILVQRQTHGMRLHELARAAGISVATAKRRLQRVRQLLANLHDEVDC
jgi:RNA polymerase sigma factor (sigma-70 family)